MKRIRNILFSNSGASILLALAVVLVCTMVAAIVLIASAANAGKGLSVQERNTSYFAMSSAAQLLIDDMAVEQPSAEVLTQVKTYACQDEHPSYEHSDAYKEGDPELIFASTSGATTPFMQIVEDAVRTIGSDTSAAPYMRSFTISAPEMESVQANFSMDDSYSIEVQLIPSSFEEKGFGYFLTLSFGAVVGDPIKTTQTEKTDSHWDGWEYTEEALALPWYEETKPELDVLSGNYEPRENSYGRAVEQFYDVTTTTTTTHISWGSGWVVKGTDL